MKKSYKFAAVAGMVVLLAALVIMGGSALYAATQKKSTNPIGYVDVEAVFESSPQKKVADKTFQTELTAMQAQAEKEVKAAKQDQQQAIMDKYQQKAAQREQELINGVLTNIDKVIQQVGNEQGVQAVFDKKSVLYGGQDLTQLVKDRVAKMGTTTTNK